MERNTGGQNLEYAFDTAGESIGYLDGNQGVWWAYYIPFQGRHLADYQNSEVYFNHVNMIGTTGIVTDYAGTLKQDELHYPWGEEWALRGISVEERFAKLQLRDSETELDPTHFRMYASGVGRWLSPDAMPGHAFSPQSFNRYAYALNNPANFIDPRGLETNPCMIDGQAGFCTTSTASGEIDLSELPSMQEISWGSYVEPATALMGDYLAATDTPLNPFAQAVFGQVGQETGFLLHGSFYGWWYGESVAGAVGYDYPAVGEAYNDVGAAASAWAETNVPGSTSALADFMSGLSGNVTGSTAGKIGYFLGIFIP